jgi:Flp pilus assembly protein TadG
MFNFIKKRLKRKDGIAMVIFIILLPLMLGFFGLAIDGGNLMMNTFKLRSACRLAALSGGSKSISDGSGHYIIDDLAAAKTIATKNFRLNFSGSTAIIDPNVSLNVKVQKKSIKVQASMEVKFYFINILGGPNSTTIKEYYNVFIN